MAFGKKRSEERTFGCFTAAARGVSCSGPPAWWLRPGCGHVTGEAQVCDEHGMQIGEGDVPGYFACQCGQPPVLTPVQ